MKSVSRKATDRFSPKGAKQFFQVGWRLDFFQHFARKRQATGNAKMLGDIFMAGLPGKMIQIVGIPAPEPAVNGLFGLEPRRIPIARQKIFAREQFSDFGMVEVFS